MNKKIKDIVKIDQTQPDILRLILNDPNNKNALSDKMMQQLQDLIVEASSNDSVKVIIICLLYTSPSPRDRQKSRMPSSA